MAPITEARAKQLFRLYLRLQRLHREAQPFGGAFMPRVLRLLSMVEDRLIDWATQPPGLIVTLGFGDSQDMLGTPVSIEEDQPT